MVFSSLIIVPCTSRRPLLFSIMRVVIYRQRRRSCWDDVHWLAPCTLRSNSNSDDYDFFCFVDDATASSSWLCGLS